MIPVTIEVGYAFDFFRGLYISPVMSGGYSYNTMNYTHLTGSISTDYSTNHEFEPIIQGGLHAGYVAGGVAAKIGFLYATIFEKTEKLNLYIMNAGLGMVF